MMWQYNLFILPNLAAGGAAMFLGAHIWRRRPAPGAALLALLMGVASLISLAFVLGIGAENEETAVLAWKLQYIFSETIPLLWLVFALQYTQYTQRQKWLTPKRWAFLLIIPTISILLIWTNEYHEFMWHQFEFMEDTPVIIWEPGFWYWVDITYNYLLLAAGTYIFLRQLKHFQGMYRFQLAAILIGVFAPWLINLLYQLIHIPFYIPLAPIGFIISGLAFSWGIYRYRLFDVLPVAHELLVQEIHDAVLVVDEHHRLLHLNPAAQKLIQVDNTASLMGQPLNYLQNPVLIALSQFDMGQTPESSIVVTENGSPRYFTVQMTPLYQKKQRLGRLFVLHDITELQKAREDAEAALRVKTAFVSNVSHELRTPLTNIGLYLDLLELNREEKFEHYLRTLHQETERLRHLIESLLQVSRLDAKKIELRKEPVNLGQLAQTLYEDRQHLFLQKELQLSLHVTPVPTVMGDPQLIEQVVTNLLSNALNYTPAGGQVQLELDTSKETPPAGIELRVSDTGHGIPPEELAHIFDRFMRGEASHQTGSAGTGLGLAISQEIIKMHQGQIYVTSVVGQGSTFTIWLPAAATPDNDLCQS